MICTVAPVSLSLLSGALTVSVESIWTGEPPPSKVAAVVPAVTTGGSCTSVSTLVAVLGKGRLFAMKLPDDSVNWLVPNCSPRVVVTP